MREATGSSLLLYIVIIIVGVVMLLFVTILSYAKAYGAKNKIINALETYYDVAYVNEDSNPVKAEIDENLRKMGYTITRNNYCNNSRVLNHLNELGLKGAVNLNSAANGRYNYCLYKVDKSTGKIDDGHYYLVVTFISYNIPVIGNFMLFPVYGETKILDKTYDRN